MVYFINNMNLQTILKLTKIASWLWTLPVEDQAEAEDIHNWWLVESSKIIKARYKEISIVRRNIREWAAQPELAEFAKKARLRYLKKQLSDAVSEFEKNREKYILAAQSGVVAEELVPLAENLSKKINGYKREITIMEGGGNVEGVITDEMLQEAREYPIENIMEVGVNGRCKCVFHGGEDYNMDIRKNYGYCYVCGRSSDPIGIYMALHGVGFREAVLRLNNK